jgi:hypothetical protein
MQAIALGPPESTRLFGPQGLDEIGLDPVNIALAQNEHVLPVGRDQGTIPFEAMNFLAQVTGAVQPPGLPAMKVELVCRRMPRETKIR